MVVKGAKSSSTCAYLVDIYVGVDVWFLYRRRKMFTEDWEVCSSDNVLPFQAMTNRATGSLRGTVESGRP